MSYPNCGGEGPSGGPNEKKLFTAAYSVSPYSIDDAMTQIGTAKKNLRRRHDAAGQAGPGAGGVVDVLRRAGGGLVHQGPLVDAVPEAPSSPDAGVGRPT
jgi:hypothetical protein